MVIVPGVLTILSKRQSMTTELAEFPWACQYFKMITHTPVLQRESEVRLMVPTLLRKENGHHICQLSCSLERPACQDVLLSEVIETFYFPIMTTSTKSTT